MSEETLVKPDDASNNSRGKIPILVEQKAYYTSMKELPHRIRNESDTHTSFNNDAMMASNESLNYEKEEHLEPTLILNDPS